MAQQVLDVLVEHEVTGSVVRIVDHGVKPGVELDVGAGDEWPGIRVQIMAADIVIATPTWTGSRAACASACSNAWTPSLRI